MLVTGNGVSTDEYTPQGLGPILDRGRPWFLPVECLSNRDESQYISSRSWRLCICPMRIRSSRRQRTDEVRWSNLPPKPHFEHEEGSLVHREAGSLYESLEVRLLAFVFTRQIDAPHAVYTLESLASAIGSIR